MDVGACEKSCRTSVKIVRFIFSPLLSIFKKNTFFIFLKCDMTWLRPRVNLQGLYRSPVVRPRILHGLCSLGHNGARTVPESSHTCMGRVVLMKTSNWVLGRGPETHCSDKKENLWQIGIDGIFGVENPVFFRYILFLADTISFPVSAV